MQYVNTKGIESNSKKHFSDKKEKKNIISVSIDAELNGKLSNYCKKYFVNKSLLIENAIREYINTNNLFEIDD